MENLELLVHELRQIPSETPWLEFKHNNYDPQMIGQDVCALANAAALCEKSCGYMIWGIDDSTHEIVGTEQRLQDLKKGNQELENWLRSLLSENADFEFKDIEIEHKKVGILIVYSAMAIPVKFEKTGYIRIGSYTKKLKDYPMVEKQLWDKLGNIKYEDQFAMKDLGLNEAVRLLDCSAYFDLCNTPLPSSMEGISHYFMQEGLLYRQMNGLYTITNLGAILFAKNMSTFPKISRKAIRIVQYDGNNRLLMKKENTEQKGYAVCFENIMKYMDALIPTEEPIVDAKRNGISVVSYSRSHRKCTYPSGFIYIWDRASC